MTIHSASGRFVLEIKGGSVFVRMFGYEAYLYRELKGWQYNFDRPKTETTATR